jgi:hypothetical protein
MDGIERECCVVLCCGLVCFDRLPMIMARSCCRTWHTSVVWWQQESPPPTHSTTRTLLPLRHTRRCAVHGTCQQHPPTVNRLAISLSHNLTISLTCAIAFSGGMIFYRKGPVVVGGETFNLEDSINWAVFPALQGGPHDHQIAAVAVALKEAMTPEFVEYQRQVLKNAKCLADELMALGYSIVSKGTSNHLMLLDLNPKKIDGARAELVLDKAHITVNKNTVPGDTKPLVPGGLRLGTPALTTRGMKEAEVKKIAQFLDSGLKLTMEINTQDGNGVEVAVEWRLVVV